MPVPMLGLNYSFVHKRTAKPLDQMQQLHISIESGSLLGAIPWGTQDQSLIHCLLWASPSKPSVCCNQWICKNKNKHCSGDLVTVGAQR